VSAKPAVVASALEQVRLGFAVFALAPDSKIPVTQNGFKNATTDPMWAEKQLLAPSAGNYGMTWPTEAPERVVSFDLDDGGGGHERPWQDRLMDLMTQYGALPPTKATDTPSGGKHAFFRWPTDVPIPPGDELFGFTVRWPGRGYVVGPGCSIRGKPYVSNGKGIAELPRAWAEAATPKPKPVSTIVTVTDGYVLPEVIGSGQRYSTLRDYAASRWVRGNKPSEIWSLVLSEVAPRFTTPKTEAELRGDFDRAMAKIEERLGPQRRGMDERDAIVAMQPILARPLAEYAVEAVVWLWHRFLPVGAITLFDGNPGEGKSTVVADLIARLTAGTEWPDGTPVGAPGDVLYITKEDDPRTQVRPRIEAAGGDVNHVRFVEADLAFPRDIARYRDLLLEVRPRLVLLDPLMSYLEGKVKAISDNDVRSAIMTPLADVSREAGCATLVIRHFNKGTGQSALMRGAGSLGGLAGSARMVLSLTTHPGEDETRVFGVVKSNYEARPKSLKATLEAAPVAGFHMTVSKAVWLGESDVSITDAMERDSEAQERVVSAMEDLREILDPMKAIHGVESSQVKAQMKARGHTRNSTEAAKKALGVTWHWTNEVPSKTMWMLPTVNVSTPIPPIPPVGQVG
jgi:DNA repair protein RadA/Sms